jgi:hypothetical protein
MPRCWLLGPSLLACLLYSSFAQAGCPHLCKLTVDSAVVEPPLVCATVTTTPYSCNCGVDFKIQNLCQSDIQIPAGTFFACLSPSKSCTTIAPVETATGEILIKDLIPGSLSFTFTNQGTTYTVSANYIAGQPDLPWYMCQVAFWQGRPAPVGFMALLGTAWFARWTRRRYRRRLPR